MLNVTELRNGTFFREGKDIFQVLFYDHVKMGRGSGNIKLKIKNLKTGAIVEKSFITGARIEEAVVEKKKVQFLYMDADSFYFMDPQTFEQFSLSAQMVENQARFLKEGLEVTLITAQDEPLIIELPLSLIYTIAETGPAERGNSVSNVYKTATLDNGLEIKVPLFIKVGDKVKVNSSGLYLERVKLA